MTIRVYEAPKRSQNLATSLLATGVLVSSFVNRPMNQQLIDKITVAFEHECYPGDDHLTDSTYGEEPAALVEEFRGKTDWQVLDSQFLDQAPDGWGSALSFFSYDALRFYLPAYLIADLSGELEQSDPSIRLCMNLTAQSEGRKIAKIWGGGTLGERDRIGFSRFNRQQVSVVVEYLFWRLDSGVYNPLVEQALEHYWLARQCEA